MTDRLDPRPVSNAEFESLLSKCTDAPSTTKFVDGARHQSNESEKNVALFCYVSADAAHHFCQITCFCASSSLLLVRLFLRTMLEFASEETSFQSV